jgi:hypothetical protein
VKNYTFHFEIEDVLRQFADALNDIIVKRYNIDRDAEDQIHVNFVYAPKTRTLHEIVNLSQHHKMPIISISVGGMRRDTNRVFNKLEGSYWADTSTKTASSLDWANLLQPVPVNISINVSILARFQTDIDQILTNFIPYTDPYFVISWRWPDIIPWSDFEIRSHARWDESVSYSYPTEIAKETPYWTMADTSFTLETWLFKNKAPDGKPIFVIDNAFTSVSAIESYEVMKSFEDMFNTDYFVISARPQPKNVDPYFTYISETALPEKTFQIIGSMLDYTDAVFLSSSDWSMFNYTTTGDFLTSGPQTVDIFSVSSFYASAAYPPFSAVRLNEDNWKIQDQNFLKFTFSPTNTGVFDVILLNGAGYGILSNDCIRPTLNPYVSGTPEYDNYVEYQHPCISGIEVRSI